MAIPTATNGWPSWERVSASTQEDSTSNQVINVLFSKLDASHVLGQMRSHDRPLSVPDSRKAKVENKSHLQHRTR